MNNDVSCFSREEQVVAMIVNQLWCISKFDILSLTHRVCTEIFGNSSGIKNKVGCFNNVCVVRCDSCDSLTE